MRQNKFITSKDLAKHNLFKGIPTKRDIQYDFNRRFITPAFWKIKKDQAQTIATRSFSALQTEFAKKLARVVNLLIQGNQEEPPALSFGQAQKMSKKIFIEFYKRAYVLGVKASGADLSAGYTLFVNKLSLPDLHKEDQWSEAAALSEYTFWSSFIKQIVNSTRTVLAYDKRILLYVKALEAHFDAGRVSGSPLNSVVYWTMQSRHSHCLGCTYMNSISPIPKENMVTTPRAGMCSCISNCNCTLKIVPKNPEEIKRIRLVSPPKETIIREMKRRKYS
jgi:hypothetical protein